MSWKVLTCFRRRKQRYAAQSDAPEESEAEEEEKTSPSQHKDSQSLSGETPDPQSGSRRSREDGPDASRSKRMRGEKASSLSASQVSSRSDTAVCNSWMPTASAIAGRFGSAMPPYNIPFSDICLGKNFPEEQGARVEGFVYNWNVIVENFNKDPAAYSERLSQARDRFGKFSKRGQLEHLHNGALEAGIPCAVPRGIACTRCRPGAARLRDSDVNGYTGIRVPDDLKELRAVVAREAPNVVGDYNVRTVFTPAVHGGLRTPSPFRNVLHQDVPQFPRILLGRESSPTNTKTNRTSVRSSIMHNALNNPTHCTPCVP
ncbi:unnamed protein product [Phytophthora lilii]|uniref:Unnamed protein product n=1 Tax=Phytophthora lilii TaxID=2077276 RepID=A0A9W6U018_9STRA|nr:unnamed protein product [Phytophthora lilii]